MLPELLGLTPAALAERLGGQERARAVFRLLREGRDPFQDSTLAPAAARRLAETTAPTPCAVETSSVSADGTVKLLISLGGGQAVETVLIPSRSRTTLCLSSQVGCARGCRFCLTATMGLLRNLSCGEIVAQVVAAIREGAARGMPPVRNVVFMGMGEPLDNLHAVTAAAEILSAEGGLGFGPRHVTVSTVGTTAQAIRAAAELPAHLAWSLHAADDETRKRLIPTARGSVQTLRDGFLDAVRDTLFVEVVLIDGVNDSLPDARAIAGLFEGFRIRGREVRINLLPMNAIEAAQAEDLHPSPPEKVSAFQETLRQSGYFCMVRKSRGVEGSSACGQLVTRHSGI